MAQHITDEPLDLDAMLAETESPDCGALVVFAGTTRIENDGRKVTDIDYTAYAPLAEKVLADLERETLRRFRISQCRIRHRTGNLRIGETSVIVVVRAPHRGDAFEAGRYAIDTLKHTAPIWKNEAYADGTRVYQQGYALTDADGTQHRDTDAV